MLRQLLSPLFGIAVVAVAVFSVGCCGPMGCGPGCGANVSCNGCDGGSMPPQMRGRGSLRRKMICGGGGCGETYIGEWISTPPDCEDPCCGDQWTGGARKARPFCWERGTLLRNLYGSRFCGGAESSASCGCDECDSCGIVDEVYAEEGYYEGGTVTSGCGGCATGNCSRCQSASAGIGTGTRIVHRPTVDPITRSAQRRSDPQVQRIRR